MAFAGLLVTLSASLTGSNRLGRDIGHFEIWAEDCGIAPKLSVSRVSQLCKDGGLVSKSLSSIDYLHRSSSAQRTWGAQQSLRFEVEFPETSKNIKGGSNCGPFSDP